MPKIRVLWRGEWLGVGMQPTSDRYDNWFVLVVRNDRMAWEFSGRTKSNIPFANIVDILNLYTAVVDKNRAVFPGS